jgi:hypothetical protein
MEVKDLVKLYFLPPGKELVNGLVFLYDDARCVDMSEQITRAPTVPTRKSPRREAQSAVASSSIPQGATAASRGKKETSKWKIERVLDCIWDLLKQRLALLCFFCLSSETEQVLFCQVH